MISKTQKYLAILTSTLLLVACGQQSATIIHGETNIADSAIQSDFELVNFQGDTVTDEHLRGKPLFIYFGFASCPDVCPAALSVMSASLNELGSKAEKIHPLFITVDPERDTPETLQAHLAFDERIQGLTGSVAQIKAATKAMHVFAQKEPIDSALGYTMNHQSMFFIIDAQGAAQVALTDDMAPKDIARVLKKYL